MATSAIIAKGLVENLPVIIDGFKSIYALRAKEDAFREALQARCAELQINSQNFSTLVQGLTELSKNEGADEETKAMYRDMIRSLFDLFALRSRDSSAFSDFMNS
ncbi:hypothetical protein KQ301_04630 [Synechococcus sp. CS-601]|nr:hypothetical protein BM449_00175 [Synechococcus sp. SynAce01]MCT0245589.1 hypothetical protein [Synechococcus sp. CS-601]